MKSVILYADPVRRLKTPIGFSRNWLWIVLLVICAVLPFANSLLNEFVYDDNGQILKNPYIRSFQYLPKIVLKSVWEFTGMPARYYRPVMTFGYLLCYKAFGFWPAGFHLVNVILHAVVVCLIFFLTRRLFGDRVMAFGAAAIFALHPIHTEAVDWIAAVTDLELTCFYLLTFWLYLVPEGRRFGWPRWAMLGSFALALLSKEQAATLPILATIFEHFYREDRLKTSWARKFGRYFPLWLLLAGYIPLRRISLGGFAVTSNYWGLTVSQMILSAISLVGQYIWKLIWPFQLCAFYVFRTSERVDSAVLLGVISGVLLVAVFWWLWNHHRLVSFGLIWLMAGLTPVLNPKWLGLNVFAERYLYLPSLGFCWVMAWGLRSLWRAASGRSVWRKAFL